MKISWRKVELKTELSESYKKKKAKGEQVTLRNIQQNQIRSRKDRRKDKKEKYTKKIENETRKNITEKKEKMENVER